MLAGAIRDEGGEPVTCASLAAARQQLGQRTFDLVLLDNGLPDGSGFDFFPELARRCPSSLVMMITGAPELGQAIRLTRNGLFDYLTKPLNLADFTASVRRARLRMARPDVPGAEAVMIGSSPQIREAMHTLQNAARHAGAPVLILGETGSGKDLAARLLHQWSFPGANPLPPYIPLNCSAVPGEMFEAELFGSEKGAYTGADKRRVGLIEAAEGGTLFLDEVAEIPLPQQAKLLRFLESREYRALGSTKAREFTGRVVAATNRPLEEDVREKRFREDLLFRLDVLTLRLPPLRERISDLEPLAEHLLTQLCAKYQRPKPFLRPEDLAVLRGYNFPGNVRELRNLLERSLLKNAPDSHWLVLDLGWLRGLAPAASVPALSVPTPIAVTPTVVAPSSPAPVAAPLPPPERVLNPIDLQEYQLIRQVLLDEKGAIRRAAAKLGLTHQALLRRLQKWPELRPGSDAPAAGEGI